jgi:hypothetical protein
MSEPNTMVGAGALAALIALAGPLLGPYIVVVLLSSGGALVAASEVETTGRFHVMAFVFRGFVFGLGFASASADFVAGYLHVAAPVALAPVSLVIGLYAHRWRSVGPIVWSLIVRLRGAPRA